MSGSRQSHQSPAGTKPGESPGADGTYDEVIDENAKVHFRFHSLTHPGRHVFQLEDADKAYGEKLILDHTTFSMERGDKIALIGANGRGKSTVLRIVAGTEE